MMLRTDYAGGQPQSPVAGTVFDDILVQNARRSGDRYDHRSGIGVWGNEGAEAGQGPAVGEATFHNLRFVNVHEPIRNTTSTFRLSIGP
jgi:hypothetical protein